MIYEGSPSSQLPGLAAVAKQKLRANNRCLFLDCPAMAEGFQSYLAAAGVDVAHEIKRGALVVSSDPSHLANGRFDVDRMLGMITTALAQALEDGYTALWATGDMMWEFGNERNLEKLLEYECRLEELLARHPELCGICRYHRDVLPVRAVQAALYTHPTVYLNETLSRINPFYTQAATLRNRRSSTSVTRVDDMLHSLRRGTAA